MNRILEFHRYTVFAVKDSGAEYDVTSVAAFDRDWVNYIMGEYSIEDLKATSQSTSFLVMISSFIRIIWYDVKSHLLKLLETCIGAAVLPLSYLIRDTPQD